VSSEAPTGPPGRSRPSRVVIDAVVQEFTTRDGPVRALDGIDLTVEPGEFVSLIGPSGCGKTTLLQLIAGFQAPSEGRVTVDGEEVRGPSPDRGVVFQAPNLFPWSSVRANVEFGPRMRRVPKAERRATSDRLLALVGLEEFARSRPDQLSGGMRQRAQIARVLANDPGTLLMDEPFGALDALTRERLQGELRRLWRTTGKTVLFVTHSVEEAAFLGSRVVALSPRPGRVAFDEPTPFGTEEHDEHVRADPTFVAFRERLAGVIHGFGD